MFCWAPQQQRSVRHWRPLWWLDTRQHKPLSPLVSSILLLSLFENSDYRWSNWIFYRVNAERPIGWENSKAQCLRFYFKSTKTFGLHIQWALRVSSFKATWLKALETCFPFPEQHVTSFRLGCGLSVSSTLTLWDCVRPRVCHPQTESDFIGPRVA